VYFDVTVSRPEGGTITSNDGQIRCGSGGSACFGRYAWSAQVVLAATPDPGWMLGTWAGDCGYTGPCVLDTRIYGADKFVTAVFGPAGEVQHGNFGSPAIHGPAFLDRLGGLPDTFDCSTSGCHGPTYNGAGIAPSCNACHAAAGWTSWLTNCTFCHGTRVKSGYAFEADPPKAAPPDAVGERFTGAPMPARTGAHQQHLSGTTAAGAAYSLPFPCGTCHAIPADLAHVGGSTARATVALSSGGHPTLPVTLGTYDPGTGTCTAYCHGDGKTAGTSPVFSSTGLACDGCHGVAPASAHPYTGNDLTRCVQCHPQTMSADGTLLVAGGKHVDGVVQGPRCDSCHAFPPATGAHVAHFGLVGPSTSGYGDTRALQEMFPGETPTTAPGVYAFGCGSCHPLDFANHRDGTADVSLYDAAAPAGSLKSLASPSAAYDGTARTCSGVYCHSSGQETPVHRATPSWTSGAALACDGCHDNPPRYASGGPGSATANNHLALDTWAWVAGHLGGVGAFGHADRHGAPGQSEAPITCQTCHFDTTDPGSTGISGFFWLDTTGQYELSGRDPTQGPVSCTACHDGTGYATAGAGRVLPLRHVNGSRDVVFDARTAIDPTIPYLPPAPDTPTKPYYRTNDILVDWAGAVVNGTTASYSLVGSAYEPSTKTCTVACHNVAPGSGLTMVWGTPFSWNCSSCHPNY
jgi:predicted CxxxxCH...CXXCH cytochrome family protein